MVVLDRLLRISAIYSAVHPAVARMAAPVVERLAALGAKEGCLLVAAGADAGLEVGCAGVPATAPAAARLRALLDGAGIEGFELSAAASSDDLCELGRFLRTRPGADAEEPHDEPAGLPPTIRVVTSRFGAARSPRARGEIRRIVEQIVSAVLQPSDALDRTKAGGARGVVVRASLSVTRKVLLAVLSRIEEEAAGEIEPALRESIVRLLSGMVRSALDERADVTRGTLTVSRLLLEMREVLRRTSGEETATAVVERALTAAERLLLPVTAGHGAPIAPMATARPLSDPDAARAAAVVRRLEEAIAAAQALDAASFDCAAEHLGLVLHVRREGSIAGQEAAVDRELQKALAGASAAQQRAVLAGFIASASRMAEPERGDRVLIVVARALRQENAARFAELLVATLEELAPAECVWLWPHLASELLLGLPPGAAAVEEGLVAALLAAPARAFEADAGRLQRTLCARGGALPGVVRRIFGTLRVEFFALYEAALALPETSGIGELVLEAFRLRPPPLPAARALAVVPIMDGRARAVLRHLLQTKGSDAERRAELDAAAVRLLVDALARQPASQRGAQWVAEAVRVLTVLPGPEGAAMLRRVARERRWLLLPAWPGRCRRIAAGRP